MIFNLRRGPVQPIRSSLLVGHEKTNVLELSDAVFLVYSRSAFW